MTGFEIAQLIGTQKSNIANLIKATKDELSNFFDDGVHNYLTEQKSKYEEMATFIFRKEKVAFDKIYFPLRCEDYREKASTDLLKLVQKDRFITLIGEAGSGKSMLTINTFHQAIKSNYKIPIIVELRNLKYNELNLLKYISQYILNRKIKSNSRILKRTLVEGRFLFLFDGYDEIDSEHEGIINNEINSFVDVFSKNDFVITTRPGTSIESLERFQNWDVSPLSIKEVKSFVTQQCNIMGDKPLGKKIINEVLKNENKQYLHFLSNPLLLSMFIFTFKFNPELPKTKSKFYWNVFDTLCTKHDSITKGGGFLHDKRSGLSFEEIENVLMWFSYKSFFDEKYSFEESYFIKTISEIRDKLQYKFDVKDLLYDLQINISILVLDGLELRFPHRSLQEYFCALLISKQQVKSKEKFYSKKVLSTVGVFNNLENFWSLCYELDKECFLEFFLMPILEEINSELGESNEKESILVKFFKFTGFTFTLIDSSLNNILNRSEIYPEFNPKTNHDHRIEAVIGFVGLKDKYHESTFFSFKNDGFLIGKGEEGIFTGKHIDGEFITLKIDFYKSYDSEMYSFLEECGFVDKVVDFRKMLKQKIDLFKSELNSLKMRESMLEL